eukprot:scaffold766_cov185-Chaetoceros_neogracile.AAC.5
MLFLLSSVTEGFTELFSVAPMMGHSNRHYRHFFRLLSKNSVLYTEMIPSSQITSAYEQALKQYYVSTGRRKHDNPYHPEQIQEFVHAVQQNPSSILVSTNSLLLELLYPHPIGSDDGPVALQLGGRDPDTLAKAAKLGTAFGFDSINLNCGCPSTSVASTRQTGAALMWEPELVAQCLEQMSWAMDEISPHTELSVKHRLGVESADVYDATWDRTQNDDGAFERCSQFVKLVSMAGKTSKVHVHARLAILGLVTSSSDINEQNNNDIGSVVDDKGESSNLWVPNGPEPQKINHKRVQYIAKKQARQATIQNRNIPPLRPDVVNRIAEQFPNLEVISNGGISSMDQIEKRCSGSSSETSAVVGAMVGRAAINHPCSFAGVDSLLWKDHSPKPTRRQVLEQYVEYCEREEAKMAGVSRDNLKNYRKKLIAAPFHLFMGEEGNNIYQRRLRKLNSRSDRHPVPSMLLAAMSEVPCMTLDKPVDDHVPWEEIEKYDFTKRAGSMQRMIY